MSSYAFSYELYFDIIICYNCKMPFAAEKETMKKWQQNGQSFYCPNGHVQHFTESENAQLKKQLEASKRDAEWVRAQRDRAEKQASAARGQVTKIKNRISNGVCPCCNRSFFNLKRHMLHMHPEFKNEERAI